MVKVLVTGGAGFIGSHLVDALVEAGHSVRVLDNLEPQVHGALREQGKWPEYRNPAAEYRLGDVRNLSAWPAALAGVSVVFHFAAATGVGQSMYQIAKYTDVNIQGTANLLDALASQDHQVQKLVLASSRAVYGEGLYRCQRCGLVSPPVRSPEQLEQKQWDVRCPTCTGPLHPLPTPEARELAPGSIYAVSKQAQEQLTFTFSHAYGLPVTALRFFNVYGPRQSLSNPYTGILTAFLQRLWNGLPPEVYEDGLMTRDFIYVADVVKACLLSLQVKETSAVNIGSGQFTTILDLARLLSGLVNPGIEPQVVGDARVGDIRHCSADNSRASALLGWRPAISLQEGLALTLAAISSGPSKSQAPGQAALSNDLSDLARQELKQARLLK